jgi:endonuclease YncB( thermonuclease family)
MLVFILRLLVFVAATTVAFGASSWQASALDETRPSCTGLEPGPARAVVRIIDGETAALDDGTELRLIGALAPRAIDAGIEPGTWPAEIAANEELRALLLGKSVELAFGGDRSDRYGRLLAQAHVREGDKRRWVQGHLLEQGLARAYTLAGNRACADALLAAERGAREARRGLWADAAYQVRPAAKPADLLRYRSTFQVVEGRIAGVAQVRGMVYLNFDADWRRASSVSLRRSDRDLLGLNAGDPKALEGKLVRVRGWIEQRTGSATGPTIELSTAGLIEVLDEPSSGAAATRPLPGSPDTDRQVPDQPRRETETKPPGLVETGR